MAPEAVISCYSETHGINNKTAGALNHQQRLEAEVKPVRITEEGRGDLPHG